MLLRPPTSRALPQSWSAHLALGLGLALFAFAPRAEASSAGISGHSTGCTGCHSPGGNVPTVTITGPTSLNPGATGTYRMTITGGPAKNSGLDVALAGGGTLGAADASTKVKNGEITQSSPKSFSGTTVTYDFTLLAPATSASLTLTGTGLSCNASGDENGDNGATARLTVTVASAATPPTIAQAASANPSPVTGKTSALSVLGADAAGEASLIYTWAKTSGTGTVTFSANGTNAAKSTTATFSATGAYTLQVTVKNGAGLTATSSVNVTVNATPTTLTVSPASVTVTTGTTQQFQAAVKDQFGQVASASGVTWTVSGGGTISSSGLFTAGSTAGGPFTVTGKLGAATGTASVTVSTVVIPPPTVATPAAANPNPVTQTTTQVSALGADSAGEASLTYTWSSTSGPANVSFSANGTNASKSSTATFTAAGTYSLQVSIANASGQTVTSSVNVTVNATPTTLSVSPANVSVTKSTTQQFQAAVVDQFGAGITGSSGVSWSVSGGGTISGSGLFSAAATAGGPYTVTATDGAASGTAQVTVTDAVISPPTIAQAAVATPGTVTQGTTALSVLGADVGGEAGLSYTWSATSGPGSVSFSPNGTNAAKASTATFSAVGSYVLEATVTNGNGKTATSDVTVTVTSLTGGGGGGGNGPQVALFGLLPSTKLSGIATLRATALDGAGIAQVSFRVDSTGLGVVTAPAYEVRFDTRQFTNGDHEVVVTATTMDGRTSSSAPTTITIANLGDVKGAFGCSTTASSSGLAGALALLAWAGLRRRAPAAGAPRR